MKIAVFGAGTMGSGIAQVFAGKGHTVLLYASSKESAQRHKDKLEKSLQKRVAKGKMAEDAMKNILDHILIEEEAAAAMPRITSTSFMLVTGLKKCIPIT